MAYIPEAILFQAREFIAAEVSKDRRWFYISGKADTHGAVQAVAKAIMAERQRCLDCQPSTAENPNEDSYQRGRFDGVMEYGRAIAGHPLDGAMRRTAAIMRGDV
jgi:hypothetical protein